MERLPTDLSKVLAHDSKAQALWDGLTPIGRRDFLAWIASAKQEATRKRRIESVPSRLLSGKRRPCCYAIVPMNLYKALGENPKAKAVWSILTPDERRDFAAWIDEAKNPSLRGIRIEEACLLLAKGKRHV